MKGANGALTGCGISKRHKHKADEGKRKRKKRVLRQPKRPRALNKGSLTCKLARVSPKGPQEFIWTQLP
eukprot:scaffold251088_cov18-Tisochrysis_lutea.AAC.1